MGDGWLSNPMAKARMPLCLDFEKNQQIIGLYGWIHLGKCSSDHGFIFFLYPLFWLMKNGGIADCLLTMNLINGVSVPLYHLGSYRTIEVPTGFSYSSPMPHFREISLASVSPLCRRQRAHKIRHLNRLWRLGWFPIPFLHSHCPFLQVILQAANNKSTTVRLLARAI